MRGQSIVLRVGLVAGLSLSPMAASAQEFGLQVGPPVAGNSQNSKSSLLVVRPGGCADRAKAQISATAEGLINGTRQTVPLTVRALPAPGVHAVPKDWPNGGVWVVNLVGTCAGKTAGAIVAIGSGDKYRREGVKLLAHRATAEEIDASLKALSTGGQR